MSDLEKFPDNFVSEQFVKYVDEKEIETIVDSLAHTLSEKYKGQELVMIGVLKGSMIFMSDLIRKIKNVKIYVDFIRVSSVGRSKESEGTIIFSKDISTNIQGRNILIVNATLDTARALNFIKKRLVISDPRSVEVIPLFDKPSKRSVPVKANYVGKQIEDQFIVGHGLDLDEYGRNFCDVHYLKYPN